MLCHKLALFLLLLPSIVQSTSANDSQPVSGPRIQILPVESVFFINTERPSSKVLTCKTAGDTPGMFSQLRWAGPNRIDNFDELMKRHYISEESPNSNIWILEFRNPKPDDEGTYYCLGNYQQTENFNVSVKVKLQNPIKLDSCDSRQFLKQGSENGKISCRITADTPQVILYKDGKPIGSRYKWNNDDALVVHGAVNDLDAGIYTIKVKSETTGERISQDIRVEVHSMPHFEVHDEALKFSSTEGEPAELKCTASGNPKPLVTWLDPQLRNLTSVGGYLINPERGTLSISRANRRDDHGDFQCVAYNTVGEIRRKVPMFVGIRPIIDNFDNKTVDEGSEVTWECRSRGDPKPNFTIRRHGLNQIPYTIGDGTTRDIDLAPEGGGAMGHIYRLTMTANRNMSGLHYCNATNEAGTAERVGYLNVNFPPDLSNTPTEQFIKRGDKLVVACHIKSYPPPQIIWKIDNSQVLNVESTIKSDGQETHVVYMTPPLQLQTSLSRFTCSASNIRGTDERMISIRYISTPGVVSATSAVASPTTVRLRLNVFNDGGDRVKFFRYRVEGRSLDYTNPFYRYKVDIKNDSILDATLDQQSEYTIRNLMPYYSYKIAISAVNDVGSGDVTELHVDTLKPTEPEPPIIIRPRGFSKISDNSVILSDYSDGYLLRWSPPELDNGDPVIKYIIKYSKMVDDLIPPINRATQYRVIEQMNERPLYASLGPFETNAKYYIELQARNRIGDSKPASLVLQLKSDRPPMPEFMGSILSDIMHPSKTTLIVLLSLAITLLIIIEVLFSFCCQVGIIYVLRSLCCPTKANSVISDKTYS